MTDVEAIKNILNSKKAEDIIIDDWKSTYRRYSRLIHPDTCNHPNASDAMARLNVYKEIIENGVEYQDEQGTFRVFDKKIIYTVTDDNRSILRRSFENFKKLKTRHDKSAVNFHRYMPESMRLSDKELIITLKDRAVPLTQQQLPQVHVNWIFSRLFEYVLWLRQINYSHMGLNPTTVFVVPETHGIIVISYYHMTELYKRAKTVSAKYKMWYPAILFKRKIATPDIDLELSKKIALYLLGDKSAAGTILKRNKDVNQEILTFLLTKHENKFEEFEQYRNLLAKNFEKKFYELNI